MMTGTSSNASPAPRHRRTNQSEKEGVTLFRHRPVLLTGMTLLLGPIVYVLHSLVSHGLLGSRMTTISIPRFVLTVISLYLATYWLGQTSLFIASVVTIRKPDIHQRYTELMTRWADVCTFRFTSIPSRDVFAEDTPNPDPDNGQESPSESIPASLDYQSIFEFFAKYQVRRIDELEKRVEEADIILRDSIQEVIAKIAEESVS